MEINIEQYEKIKKYLPVQRGNVSMSNVQLINAILYVAENGCKWRSLPERFGNWHTIYVRMNRWSKKGTLQRVFEALQMENVINVRVEAVSIDSTSVKAHPSSAGALKKTAGSQSGGQGEERQRRFIWSPQLTERLYHSRLAEERRTILRKGRSSSGIR